jgi:adenylyl-sulfate kinase
MIFPIKETISLEQRISAMHQRPKVIWLTGLSGSGKSTLATGLEKALFEKGFKPYLLDGDNIRSGLNKDLGFSPEDRKENIRRIGEVCKILYNAGLVVITSFISPYRADRELVRSLIPPNDFIEVYVNASLEACEARDVKGLYKKARKGLIPDFTGIDSPYEPPENAELILNTDQEEADKSRKRLDQFVLTAIGLTPE